MRYGNLPDAWLSRINRRLSLCEVFHIRATEAAVASAGRACRWLGDFMAIRETGPLDRAGRMARLEAENARLRRRAAELSADVSELQEALGVRRSEGAVDPAHRLLVVSGGERGMRRG